MNDDIGYSDLLRHSDHDAFAVRTLKTYLNHLVAARDALHDDLTSNTRTIGGNDFDAFDRNRARAEEAIAEVCDGQHMPDVGRYTSAVAELTAEYRALAARHEERRALDGATAMISREVDRLQAALEDLARAPSASVGDAVPGIRERLAAAMKSLATARQQFPRFDWRVFEFDVIDRALASYEARAAVARDLEARVARWKTASRGILATTWGWPPGIGYHTHVRAAVADFADRCRELDYPATLAALAGLGDETLRSIDGGAEIATFLRDEFPPQFARYLEATYVPAVNRHVDEAFRGRGQDNVTTFVADAEIAVEMVDAALGVVPDEPTLRRIERDARKALQMLSAQASRQASAAFTSQFHAAHANEIVFAGTRLVPGHEPASAPRADFAAGEAIYARAYFTNSLQKLLPYASTELWVIVKFTVNPAAQQAWGLPASFQIDYHLREGDPCLGESTLEIDLAPAVEATARPGIAARVASFLGELSPRLHTIRVEVYFGGDLDQNLVVAGSFDIDCADGQERYLELSAALAHGQIVLNLPPAPSEVDPDREHEIAELARAAGRDVLRVILTYPGMEIVRHPVSGVPLFRWMQATVVHRMAGDRILVQDVVLKQAFADSYGALYLASWERGAFEILAANVNR